MTIPKAIANVIVDPKAYSAGTPVDEAFAWLRKEMPFAQAQPDGFDRFWVASKHADILEIEQRVDVFRSGLGPQTLLSNEAMAIKQAVAGQLATEVRSLVSVDGLEHKNLRAITFHALTPKNIRKLEDDVRSIAKSFVDQMMARAPECDFAKDIAFLYPLRVIMSVLGVPESDEPFMLKLSQELFNPEDPDLNREGRDLSAADAIAGVEAATRDLERYFNAVTDEMRNNPQDNINSLIANAKIDGEFLTPAQRLGYYTIAATAGHDTTSNTTAGAFWALAEHPDIFNKLKENPDMLPGFIDESIRWVTPVKHFMRIAAEDAEIRGQSVKKGDWIMLSYHSANQDEDIFENPLKFDISRKIGQHAAFGYGPHVCLGQHLARMEMRLLWEELLPRLKSVTLTSSPQRTRSNFVCGPKSVPVRFETN